LNSVSSSDAYPNYFLGVPYSYSQGAAQAEDLTNYGLYLFAQDSWKIKPNLTLNYGFRWELNTPYVDSGNRLQTFRPGQDTTQYPCWLSASSAQSLGTTPGDCGPTSANYAYFPTGLVFRAIRVFRGVDFDLLQGLCAKIWLGLQPQLERGPLGEDYQRPGKIHDPRRLWNFL